MKRPKLSNKRWVFCAPMREIIFFILSGRSCVSYEESADSKHGVSGCKRCALAPTVWQIPEVTRRLDSDRSNEMCCPVGPTSCKQGNSHQSMFLGILSFLALTEALAPPTHTCTLIDFLAFNSGVDGARAEGVVEEHVPQPVDQLCLFS